MYGKNGSEIPCGAHNVTQNYGKSGVGTANYMGIRVWKWGIAVFSMLKDVNKRTFLQQYINIR